MRKSSGKRRSGRKDRRGGGEGVVERESKMIVNPALETAEAEEADAKVEGGGEAIEYDVFDDALTESKLYR